MKPTNAGLLLHYQGIVQNRRKRCVLNTKLDSPSPSSFSVLHSLKEAPRWLNGEILPKKKLYPEQLINSMMKQKAVYLWRPHNRLALKFRCFKIKVQGQTWNKVPWPAVFVDPQGSRRQTTLEKNLKTSESEVNNPTQVPELSQNLTFKYMDFNSLTGCDATYVGCTRGRSHELVKCTADNRPPLLTNTSAKTTMFSRTYWEVVTFSVNALKKLIVVAYCFFPIN